MKNILILMFLFLPNLSIGQLFLNGRLDSMLIPNDDWKKDSAVFSSEELVNSPYELYRKADSCAKIKDSVDASFYFSKIDPYYFLHFGVNPITIDSVFDTIKVISPTRKSYLSVFNFAYDQRKTDLYDTFKVMAQESGSLQYSLWHCKNTDSLIVFTKRMRLMDSNQFAFLYHYVRLHGWPSLQDGSLYAQAICRRDLAHHVYYLPILRKAAIEGKAAPATYYKLLEHLEHELPHTEMLFNQKNKIIADISPLMYGEQVPVDTLNKIANEIKHPCSVKYVLYVCECHDMKECKNLWWDKMRDNFPLQNFENKNIYNQVCGKPNYYVYHRFKETKTNSAKLYLLLLY